MGWHRTQSTSSYAERPAFELIPDFATSTLTKTGPGVLSVSTLPPTLSATSGTVRFVSPLTATESLVCANGVTILFGAVGNSFNSLDNAASLRYTADPTVFSVGVPIVTSSDASLLSTIAANFDVPAAYGSDVSAVVSDGTCSADMTFDQSTKYTVYGWTLRLDESDDPSVKRMVVVRSKPGTMLLIR